MMRKETEIVPLLIKEGAKIEARTKDGSTPLHYAATAGNLKTVNYLLDEGANIRNKNMAGRYPIHEAISLGQLEVTKIFLDKDREILSQTPFDIAAKQYATAAGLRSLCLRDVKTNF